MALHTSSFLCKGQRRNGQFNKEITNDRIHAVEKGLFILNEIPKSAGSLTTRLWSRICLGGVGEAQSFYNVMYLTNYFATASSSSSIELVLQTYLNYI